MTPTIRERLHRLLDWLLRIEHAEPEPDWQALVDAVDLAADIADPWPWRRAHVVRGRWAAQIVSDHYNRSVNLDGIDAELFALDAALFETSR